MRALSVAVSRTAVLYPRPTSTLGFQRWASTSTSQTTSSTKSDNASESAARQDKMEKLKKVHKSMAEADDEMRKAMENLAGDGGEAGLELEDGKAVSMKRGVRENMFRYI
ncbi:hypothetical protein A1O1_02540 [Capronia coronata CBS 617.96]|uniref:Uncharacterized protein n=1 Tax=Capronia coronata CBS 617.96 TaxID=1182541 RepID=W9YMJ6_9EURO|nr:uncharacterized protein A1O1_02540 [Capronia coronata CBS 617.96]EXJ94147.1 hypothetical protein A1O1_02540 [Capronia coronata CBS 617.96]